MKNVQYIGNDSSRGIQYDWKKINREIEKLKIPTDFFNPAYRPISNHAWNVFLSERALGKTSGILLMGLVMYKLYGTVTVYCRSKETQIMPKHTGSLFNVILENGYIEKLTNGFFNSITYKSRRWYLCKINGGKETKRDNNPFCIAVSVDKTLDIKSGLNLPTGDLIVYDEFIDYGVSIADRYLNNNGAFVKFCDLVSTIFRLRESGKIILLGNTINRECEFFHDLEIYDVMNTLECGDNISYKSAMGTDIYIEWLKPVTAFASKKKTWVQKFVGFQKPELSAITGQPQWAVKNYPHIPDNMYHTICNKIYISHNGKLVRLEIVTNDSIGLCIYAHWASRCYDDSIMLVKTEITKRNEMYGLGTPNLNTLIRRIQNDNKIYYASNDVGDFVENYMKI